MFSSLNYTDSSRNAQILKDWQKNDLWATKSLFWGHGFATYQDIEFMCYELLDEFDDLPKQLSVRFPFIIIKESHSSRNHYCPESVSSNLIWRVSVANALETCTTTPVLTDLKKTWKEWAVVVRKVLVDIMGLSPNADIYCKAAQSAHISPFYR